VLSILQAPEMLLPILEVMPLQLLAYHISVRRASTNRGFGKVGDNRVS